MPRVSVIMPAYNAEKYIEEAINSILNQTFRDFELIIINDCSKDGTEGLINAYDDARIVYVRNDENMGVARTLNRGLELAKGEYIARMDADDISDPKRLEYQVAYLDANLDIAVLGTGVELFSGDKVLERRTFSQDADQMNIDLLIACGLAHPSVMMRRKTICALGGYDPDYEGLEDYELWVRVSDGQGVAAIGQILLRYRVHESQVTKNPSPKYLQRLRRLKNSQLKKLGLPTEGQAAECYYAYCAGTRPDTRKGVKALCVFLESVMEANYRVRKYDPELLERNVRAMAATAAAGLKLTDALAISGETKLVNLLSLLKRKLR